MPWSESCSNIFWRKCTKDSFVLPSTTKRNNSLDPRVNARTDRTHFLQELIHLSILTLSEVSFWSSGTPFGSSSASLTCLQPWIWLGRRFPWTSSLMLWGTNGIRASGGVRKSATLERKAWALCVTVHGLWTKWERPCTDPPESGASTCSCVSASFTSGSGEFFWRRHAPFPSRGWGLKMDRAVLTCNNLHALWP